MGSISPGYGPGLHNLAHRRRGVVRSPGTDVHLVRLAPQTGDRAPISSTTPAASGAWSLSGPSATGLPIANNTSGRGCAWACGGSLGPFCWCPPYWWCFLSTGV